MNYRDKIHEMVNKMTNEDVLKRLYRFTQYLYIYADDISTDTQEQEPVFRYTLNDTMKLLAHQVPSETIGNSGIAQDAFQDVINAHCAANKRLSSAEVWDIAQDAFSLGFIYGKRAERAKKMSRAHQ